jgi:hypothetical protein
MKRMMVGMAIAVAAALPAAAPANQVRRIELGCPPSSVATDVLRQQFDGYHEMILYAWIDRQWEELCPL